MARGFDSKSVESQQADYEERRQAKPGGPAEDPAVAARRRMLELSRARAVADRSHATVPAHRTMLDAAIKAIDAQLAALPTRRIEQ